MIKSRHYVDCQTNKLPGMPQENVFFQGTFRKPEDYAKPFTRSSESNSDFQVYALFSAQGPDSIAATVLQKLAKTFSEAFERVLSTPAPDVIRFSSEIVQVLNAVVIEFSLAKKANSLKVSFTSSIIFEDMLYIISLGNTRAYILRDRKWIPLTEDDTVANHRVKNGELSREEAQKHPDSQVLTQYLGMPIQDGEKLVPTRARYKLSANDEVFLLGVGVIKYVPESIMAFIMNKSADMATKLTETLNAAVGGGAKGGLSVVAIRIDELTASVPVVLPAIASLGGVSEPNDATARYRFGDQSEAGVTNNSEDDPWSENASGKTYNEHSERGEEMPGKYKSTWKKRLGVILIPIVLFALCALIGYFTTYAVLNWRKVEVKADPGASSTVNQDESLNTVMYSLSDNVSVLSEESTESQVLQVLSRGEPVKLISFGATFSKIQTAAGNTGYVLTLMLSELDPTIGEEVVEMTADPTPIPEFTQPPETQTTEPPATVEETTGTVETTESAETTATETTAAETTAGETTTAETTAAETTAAETTAAETTAAETTAAETTAAVTTAAETTAE
jgi:protein phosphatase